MPITSLFPTQVYAGRLSAATRRTLNERLLAESRQLRLDDAAGRRWSVPNYPGGYTSYASANRMHTMSPTFAALERLLDAHVARFTRALQFDLRGRRIAFLLCAFAAATDAGDTALPWSFVNGSAEGYSIKLVSASPPPGTKMAVGQIVNFKVTISYQLSIADTGLIVLVLQDENNKNLQAGTPQQKQTVSRGRGSITLRESFTVPTGSNEVRLFIPLVPQGVEHTDGELVLRYPVSYEVKSSDIGYPSVAAALADLHSNPGVQFGEAHGWTTAEDRIHYTFWSFPPAGDPAYPSAVKRMAIKEGGGISMKMVVLCESTQSACDKLGKDFQALPNGALTSV